MHHQHRGTDRLIESIIVPGTRRYYMVTNPRGKRWLLPGRHMRIAMELYQPGSRAERMLSRYFPTIHRVPGAPYAFHAEVRHLDLRADLRQAIAKAFGIDDFEWALYGGTPCVHQKITIQIYKGDNHIGYVKVSDNPVINELFNHEREVLARVEGMNVPRLLEGDVKGLYLFIQTTRRTLKSADTHKWTPVHQQFIEDLARRTRHTLRFEDSDYYAVLQGVEPYLDILPPHQKEIIVKARAEVIDRMKGRDVEFCVYQGDFTPWNMFINPDGLFVFDWEYARLSYPPLLDKWHYIVQTAIFERILTHDEIEAMMEPYFDEPSLKLYLLDVICHFTEREQGHFPHCMGQSQELWCRLLSKCRG